MEHEPKPEVELTVGDKLIQLPKDKTDLYYFNLPYYEDLCHIYTIHPDNPDQRVMIFGVDEDFLDVLAEMGYRQIFADEPSSADIEAYIDWQLSGLDEEWENYGDS